MKFLTLLAPIVVAASLSLSLNSKADVYDQGLSAAIGNAGSTISDFAQLQMETKTQNALNALVAAANEALAQKGFVEEAQGYQREWEQNYASYFTSYSAFDIGDHAPLSLWLSNYYSKTRERLGDPVMKLLHLDDLYTLNYTIPVVFHPKGDTKGQDHWNQMEYQRHFIPFASIVTYWGSFAACRVVAMKLIPLKKWCSNISLILRSAVKSMVAPKLSNYIYAKFSGKVPPAQPNYSSYENYYQQEIMKIRK